MKKEETGLDRARIDCALRCRNEIPLLQVFLIFLILIVLSKVEIPYPAYGSSGGKSQFHFIDTRQGIDKSGTAYTYTPVWRLYGVMPLEDLLAGSIDFTPLQFIS